MLHHPCCGLYNGSARRGLTSLCLLAPVIILVHDSTSIEFIDPADLPSFAGALYCSSESGCSLYPVAVGANFSGVYGTGESVAAASSSASRSDRRRTRRLQARTGIDGNGSDERVTPSLEEYRISLFLRTRQVEWERFRSCALPSKFYWGGAKGGKEKNILFHLISTK